jgi:hypothetical protein
VAKKLDVSIGNWWRFSRYEVVDGFIRPTRHAALEEYDPWEEYSRSLIKKEKTDPPFLSLTQLIDRIDPPSGSAKKPAKQAEQEIINWCNKYGLLGLLPQSSLIAVLNARWETQKIRPPDRPRLVPTTYTVTRINYGWRREWDAVLDGPDEFRLGQKDRIVPDEYVPISLQRPGVLEQSFGGSRFQWTPFSDSWGLFFPDVPPEDRELFRYPIPLSKEFWGGYAEPIHLFRAAAVMFRDTVSVLTSVDGSESLADANPSLKVRISEARDVLNSFLSPVAPTLDLDAWRDWRQKWVCKSLLSSFAMMVFRDLTEGLSRIRSCRRPRCRRVYVTSAYQSQYCSDGCRWAAQKQRFRDTHPPEKLGLGKRKRKRKKSHLPN